MIIFKNNIRRLIRDKGFFLTMFFPLIFILFIIGNMNFGSTPVVSIIDKDGTKLTRMIQEEVKNKCIIKEIDESDINKELLDYYIDYAIVIDKGFTEEIIKGEDPKFKGYKIKETNAAIPVSIYLESQLDSIKMMAKSINGDETLFYRVLDEFKNGSLGVSYETLGDRKMINTYASLGFLIMGMLVFSANSTSIVLRDKEQKTFYRTFAAPISVKNYMIQNILSFYVLSVVQVLGTIFAMITIFKADFGDNLLSIIILFLVFSFVSVTFGIMISSFSKSPRQAGVISSLSITPMCMLGGCYWDRSVMPDVLVKLSNFVPTKWMLEGAEKAFFSTGVISILGYVLILLLFAVVFFLIGTLRKIDIEF